MKEAIVNADLSVTVQDSPTPTPGRSEILVRVVAFGTNPKDWKYPLWQKLAHNSGDDVAGYVEAVGEDVFEFKKGDRVAGFHVIGTPGGAFAEYAILPAYASFLVPPSISFEEASTIPLAALTAVIGLFDILALPSPWQIHPESQIKLESPTDSSSQTKPESSTTPLIIYGASTSVGAFAIKLAAATKSLHPLIAIGSSSSHFVTDTHLDPSQGDVLIDYTAHNSPEALADAIKDALAAAGVAPGSVYHAFDAVSEHGSFDKVLVGALGGSKPGRRPLVATVLPVSDASDQGVDAKLMGAVWSHTGGWAGKTFARIWSMLFASGLQEGWFRGHPYEVVPGGLYGVEDAMKRLKEGKVRAKKLVGRVAETEGI